MSEQIPRVTDVVDLLNKVCFVQYTTGWSSTSLAKDAVREITRLRQLLSEAETREREARAKALEEVIAAIETGREVRDPCCRDYSTIVVDYTIDEAVEIIRAMQSEER